jgi:Alpha-L-arabinofuranosidase B, catalytic
LRRILVLLGILLALTLPAEARMHAGPVQLTAGHRLQGAIAPLDGAGAFASPGGAYSLRRLKSTYTGPGIKLRRTTGGTQDINFLGFTGFTGAPLDVAAAAAFCAATTCFVDTWYDQSGNARHQTQAAAATQPQYLANCGNGLPCLEAASSVQYLQSAGVTWTAGKTTFGVVGQRSAGTAQRCYFISKGNGQFGGNSTPGLWVLTDFVTELNVTGATEGVWHAALGVIDAPSLMRIDGTETTGAAIAGTASGTMNVLYGPGAGVTCRTSEALVWDNYALAAAERAALQANQKNYWGTP